MTSYLSEIDKIVENAKSYSSLEKLLNELSIPIGRFFDKEDGFENHLSLFDINNTQAIKRHVSYCLLRIYSIKPKLFMDTPLKHKVIALFGLSIQNIYAELGLNEKSETFEIENKLIDYVKNKEAEINLKICADIDFYFIHDYGISYKSTIKQRKSNPIIWTFLSENIDDKLFTNIFKILDDYNDGNEKNKFNLYNKAMKELDVIIERGREVDTKYSNSYIIRPFKSIKKALAKDFKNNPFSKPAKLQVYSTEKKYPFKKGASYKIHLLVKNNSTGYASDAMLKITSCPSNIIDIDKKDVFFGTIKTSSIIDFEYTGLSYSESVNIEGYIEWVNFDGEKIASVF